MEFLGVGKIADVKISHIKSLLKERYIRFRIMNQRLPIQRTTRYGDLFFMTEQLPNPESRVDLSPKLQDKFGYPVARVNWQLSQEDLDSFASAHNFILNRLEHLSPIASIRKDDTDNWAEAACSAAHHLGTVRMGSSVQTGVVDSNLKVFGANNLWICDGSVFPTAGSANPSLTICALGHRLANHLLATAVHRPVHQSLRTLAN